MTKHYTCPDCGADITELVAEAMHEKFVSVGSKVTTKKHTASKKNVKTMNAAYTPEKRKAAYQKRLATIRAKKAAEAAEAAQKDS